MALTFTKYIPDSIHAGGDIYEWIGKVTFDNSYPTNGEAITAADFGGDDLLFVGVNAASSVVTKSVYWDRTNSKLKIFVEDGTSGIAAEAANASDQSLVTVDVRVLVRDR